MWGNTFNSVYYIAYEYIQIDITDDITDLYLDFTINIMVWI